MSCTAAEPFRECSRSHSLTTASNFSLSYCKLYGLLHCQLWVVWQLHTPQGHASRTVESDWFTFEWISRNIWPRPTSKLDSKWNEIAVYPTEFQTSPWMEITQLPLGYVLQQLTTITLQSFPPPHIQLEFLLLQFMPGLLCCFAVYLQKLSSSLWTPSSNWKRQRDPSLNLLLEETLFFQFSLTHCAPAL